MDLSSITERVKSIPSWIWIAGTGIVALIAVFLMKGSSGSSASTVTGYGETSDFTTALSSLSDAITNMGQNGGGGGTSSSPSPTPISPGESTGSSSGGGTVVNTGSSTVWVKGNSYVVESGDTVTSLARKYKVTAAQIRSWNGITTVNDLSAYLGKMIYVTGPGPAPTSTTSTVKPITMPVGG
jgi:LysM repeat protein